MTLVEALKHYRYHLFLLLMVMVGLYWNIVPAMVSDWYRDDNYSHGFIVPLVTGYFIYVRSDELARVRVAPAHAGLAVVVLALLQLTVGWFGTEYFTMRSSLVVLLAGLVIYLFGMEAFRALRLPICYLLFMVPIPYIIYDAVAFPLKLLVSRVSVAALQMMGVVAVREGNIIMFPSLTLEVADACSGIRSLVSLAALAVAYAFFISLTPARRAILIAASVPIALFANALRVIGTGVLAQWWGEKAAKGFFHEFAGLAVFALAMVLLVALGGLLKSRGGRDGERG